MSNGWTNSTLHDVEALWKKRQRELYAEIPKPRFTQKDILERRAQQNASAKSKKAKLTRTFSTPSSLSSPTTTRKPTDDSYSTHTETLPDNTPTTHKFRYYEQPPVRKREVKQARAAGIREKCLGEKRADNKSDTGTGPAEKSNNVLFSVRSDGGRPDEQANTLETLTYAIDIAENAQRDTCTAFSYQSFSQPLPDIEHIEPNLCDEEEAQDDGNDKSSDGKSIRCRSRSPSVAESPKKCARLDIMEPKLPQAIAGNTEKPTSPPPSPVTAAAQAIMMFFNDHYSAKPQSK